MSEFIGQYDIGVGVSGVSETEAQLSSAFTSIEGRIQGFARELEALSGSSSSSAFSNIGRTIEGLGAGLTSTTEAAALLNEAFLTLGRARTELDRPQRLALRDEVAAIQSELAAATPQLERFLALQREAATGVGIGSARSGLGGVAAAEAALPAAPLTVLSGDASLVQRTLASAESVGASEETALAGLKQMGISGERLARAMDELGISVGEASAETKAKFVPNVEAVSARIEQLGASDASAILTAQARLEAAELRLSVAFEKEAATQEEADAKYAQAVAQREAAQLSLNRALEKAAAQQDALNAEQGGAAGGGRGGFFGGVTGGYGGGQADPLQQLGFAFKYFAFYQAFALGQQLISKVRTETEAYSLAVQQLTIALGGQQDQAQSLAATLSDISASYGQAPQVGLTGGVEFIRAFQGQATKEQLGVQGANASGLLNVLGKPANLEVNQTALRGIITSFGLPSSAYGQVLDAVTSAAQSNGFQSPEALLPGLAQISDLGAQSGFTVGQTAQLVGSITKFTGETSDAAAGELRRFLGRSGNAAFQNIFSEYGINTNQPLAQELAQLAPIYQGLGPQAQSTIVSQLGGGRAGAAVVASLENLRPNDPNGVFQRAANVVPGTAATQAQALLSNTFAGVVAQLDGQFSQLAKNIGVSGLGGQVTFLAKGITDLLSILNQTLVFLNGLNPAIQQIIIGTGEAALALKLLGGGAGISGGLARVSQFGSNILGAGAASADAAATTSLDAAITAHAGASVEDAAATGAAAEAESALAVARTEGAAASTAAGISAAGLAVGLGVMAAAVVAAGFDIYAVASALNSRKTFNSVEEQAQADLNLPTATAAQRQARDYALQSDQRQLAQGADTFGGKLALGGAVVGSVLFGDGGKTQDEKTNDAIAAALAADGGRNNAARANPAAVAALGGDVSGYIRNAIAQSGGPTELNGILKGITSQIGQGADLEALLNPDATKGQPGLTTLAKQIETEAKQLPSISDQISALSALKQSAAVVLAKAKETGNATEIGNAQQIVDQAQNAYYTTLEKQVKEQEKAILAKGKNAADYAKIRALVEPLVKQAAEDGNVNAVTALLSGLDTASVNAIKRSIEGTIAAVQAAIKTEQDALEAAQTAAALSNSTAGYAQATSGKGGPGAALAAEQAKLAAEQKAIATLGSGAANANLTGKNTGTAAGSKDSASAIAAAAAQAAAIPGDPISQAQAALAAARDKLSGDKAGTVAYYNDLKALHDAQYALAQAELTYANDVATSRIDTTNPVAVARAKVAADQRKLAQDRSRGAGNDVLVGDRNALTTDQNAAQKTAFDQQLSDYTTSIVLSPSDKSSR